MTTPSVEILACPVVHLVDESSTSEEEATLLKRRRVETMVIPEHTMTVDMEASCTSATGTAPPPEIVTEARSLETTEAAAEIEILGAAEIGLSSAGGRGKMVNMEHDGYGFDIDTEEVQTFEEIFIRVEVRIEGPTRNIAIPMDFNLLVNSKSMVPALAPLCMKPENRTLQTLKDANLSFGIYGMDLRVSPLLAF